MVLTRQASKLLSNVATSNNMSTTEAGTTQGNDIVTPGANPPSTTTAAVTTAGLATTSVTPAGVQRPDHDLSFSSDDLNETIVSPPYSSITAQSVRREFREGAASGQPLVNPDRSSNIQEIITASIGLAQTQFMKDVEERIKQAILEMKLALNIQPTSGSTETAVNPATIQPSNLISSVYNHPPVIPAQERLLSQPQGGGPGTTYNQQVAAIPWQGLLPTPPPLMPAPANRPVSYGSNQVGKGHPFQQQQADQQPANQHPALQQQSQQPMQQQPYQHTSQQIFQQQQVDQQYFQPAFVQQSNSIQPQQNQPRANQLQQQQSNQPQSNQQQQQTNQHTSQTSDQYQQQSIYQPQAIQYPVQQPQQVRMPSQNQIPPPPFYDNPQQANGWQPNNWTQPSGQRQTMEQNDNINAEVSNRKYESPGRSPLASWGVKFDGTGKSMNVQEFIFRVGELRKDYNCSDREVLRGFHHLLEGPALNWYWNHRQFVSIRSWDELEGALLTQYRRFEKEYEVQMKILNRRQLPQESFEEFYNSVIKLRNQQDNPYDEGQLVEIMRGNLKPSLAQMMFPVKLRKLPEFCREVKRAENLLANQRQTYQQRPSFQQRVNEIEYEEEEVPVGEIEVDSLRPTSHYTCWNCKVVGHSFVDCPSPTRRVFCFKCGRDNVVTPKCPKCQGNRLRNPSQTGETRSTQT